MPFQQLHRPVAFEHPQIPLEVAQLALTWRELEAASSIRFEEDTHDGPAIKYALLELPGHKAVSLYSYPPPHELATLVVPAAESDPFGLLDELLKELQLPASAIKQENELLKSKPRWQVKRQDSNGQTHTLGNWWAESQAQFHCQQAPQHYPGQRCWVELVNPPPCRQAP